MIISKDIRTLEIGSQKIFHNNGTLPRMVFDPDAIVGWDDSADIKRDTTARPISHGDFFNKGFYSGKLITITGYALANHPEELHDMRDYLMSVLQSGDEQWVAVSNLSGTRYMRLSQGGSLSWVQELDTYAKWKVDLYAADPRMYSLPQYAQAYSLNTDTSGLVVPITFPISFGGQPDNLIPTLVNYGNTEAWPVFTVNASLPKGFRLDDGRGNIVSFAGETFLGSPVVIDMFKGTATVSGVDRSYQLSSREWFSIPKSTGTLSNPIPGAIKVRYTTTLESNTSTNITWRSTWV